MKYNLTGYEKDLYKNWIIDEHIQKVMDKTTIAVLKTKYGFEIVGSSACVNPDDYDFEIGAKYAIKDALNKLDEIVGFYRQIQLQEQLDEEGDR